MHLPRGEVSHQVHIAISLMALGMSCLKSSICAARTSSTAIETIFVTFGTPNFSQARSRYMRSLARYGYTRVLAFDTESPIIAKARDENPEIFAATRGYGYWIWKPYIIEAAL